jgi:short subunit dehydrogenase-like uncharacterized protein
MARRLGLEARVFDLDSPDAVLEGIRGTGVVLHCAGPYSRTSRPMVDACLRGRVHYLDITGEFAVLEAVLSRDGEARAAAVVLLPAAGFDVVPTDCMAKTLQEALPDATRLELAFSSGAQSSPGTAKSAVEGLHLGARVREDGVIVTLPRPRTREIPFAGGARFCMSIPWGDLVTAYHSTKIPSITVYAEVPRRVARAAPLLRYLEPVLKMPSVVRFLQRTVEKRAKGPTDEQRRTHRTLIWGRAENMAGAVVEGHLEIPEGYAFTTLSAVLCAERVLRGDVRPGATTPSLAFGADFVTTLPGVSAFRVIRC